MCSVFGVDWDEIVGLASWKGSKHMGGIVYEWFPRKGLVASYCFQGDCPLSWRVSSGIGRQIDSLSPVRFPRFVDIVLAACPEGFVIIK